MAEKETESKAAVYRSVSFKKLESCKVNNSGRGAEDQHHKSEGSESGALPPQGAEAAAEHAQPSHAHSATVARKVSKFSAATLSTAELKKGFAHPSVRLLSERFRPSTRNSTTDPNTGVLKSATSPGIQTTDDSLHDTGCVSDQNKDPSEVPADRCWERKCYSAQESVSGSDSDRGQRRRVGKTPGGTHAGVSTYKSRRSYRSPHGETIHVDSTWPSVTKIRKLFGDGNRKPHRSTSDAEDVKSTGDHVHHSFSAQDSSVSLGRRRDGRDTTSSDHDTNSLSVDSQNHTDSRYQGTDSSFSTEKYSYGGDRRKRPPDLRIQGNTREGAEIRSDGELRPSPPTPPPRSSSICQPPRSRLCTYGEGRQTAAQSPHGLHSQRSSSQPQAGPSADAAGAGGRLSSGGEEDGPGGRAGRSRTNGETSTHGSRNKHGTWTKPLRRSSGSEEDGFAGLAHHGRDVRRRSLRKKKKSSSSRDDGESDDSDGQPVTMERPECQQQACNSQTDGRRFEGLRSRAWQTQERGHPVQGSFLVQDGYRPLYKGTEGENSTGSVPHVSRVSKVNIPSFLCSPLESRSSSRYSSTETLKEEDQPTCTSSSSVLSKTYHGNATMYRSPSFGHGDNFSRAPVRVRPRLVPSLCPGERISKTKASHSSVINEKATERISTSNPDIASETLKLLNYLKTDLPGLRMKRRGQDDEEGLKSSVQGVQGTSAAYRVGSRPPGLTTRRPSLKDLTATLRRAKSFTYSDMPLGRRYSASGSAVRSSSEQRLDCERDGDQTVVSDREVESDDCRGVYGYEEPMPTPLQERYVQEARQVIRDICQMSAGKEEDDFDDNVHFKRKENFGMEENGKEPDKMKQQDTKDEKISVAGYKEQTDVGESEKCLPKRSFEENMFCDKSLDELSGHESSLTDEGIVTEPEVGSSRGTPSSTDLLGETLTAWTPSGLYEEQWPGMTPEKNPASRAPSVRTEYEAVAIGGDVSIGKHVNQVALEAPPTPGALRRRRKFSAAGNNGSDSSNGSNGESNNESAYRSLSDPMPHRHRPVTDDGSNNFSVDSNLLGSLSLSSKAGMGVDSSAADLSECTCSAASDLSVCSDVLRDYSTVIHSIVHEPGAMDRLTDEKANGKTVKKKSFSDPSRRGELATQMADVQRDPKEAVNELEQPIPPSSSEPILSEQRDELWELNGKQTQSCSSRRARSQSEHALPSHLDRNGNSKMDDEEAQSFPFDPKLAQVLSPCISRRNYKKRTHRVTNPQSCDDGEELGEEEEEDVEDQAVEDHVDRSTSIQLTPPKTRPKHVRHTSEPAMFVPIMPTNTHTTQDRRGGTFKTPATQPPIHCQGGGTPSLEDVTEQYSLALNPSEGTSDSPAPGDGAVVEGIGSVPAAPTGNIEPQLERKSSEELTPAPLKTKPRVMEERDVTTDINDARWVKGKDDTGLDLPCVAETCLVSERTFRALRSTHTLAVQSQFTPTLSSLPSPYYYQMFHRCILGFL
ncbi:uncharacterized protein LOC143508647 [Brachyhypopomus gauderio]|uniref:uncharacterized protein LOC143508647 n=1 Tax=Brachyhypopomus gauderio TaxID=698409 RepID=UPI0040435717